MGKYILRRLLLLLPTLVGMSLLIFFMVHLMPGDIVDAMIGADPLATPEAKAALRRSFGLDEPLLLQYVRWIAGIVQGDFGKSFRTNQPLAQNLLQCLPITIELACLAVFMSVIVAVPLGVLSAIKRNSQIDFWARIAGLLGLAFPNFWLATMFLLITSVILAGTSAGSRLSRIPGAISSRCSCQPWRSLCN